MGGAGNKGKEIQVLQVWCHPEPFCGVEDLSGTPCRGALQGLISLIISRIRSDRLPCTIMSAISQHSAFFTSGGCRAPEPAALPGPCQVSRALCGMLKVDELPEIDKTRKGVDVALHGTHHIVAHFHHVESAWKAIFVTF